MRDVRTVFVDGKALSDFGVYLTDACIFQAPSPIYEKVSVDGRNGDLIIETGKYGNIEIEYPAVIFDFFERNYVALRDFLLSRQGYCRIEDTFTPNRFRMGKPIGDLSPAMKNGHHTRLFNLHFDCKPQWYLSEGEMGIHVPAGGSVKLINPTNQKALPKILVSGTGTFSVGSNTATLSANNGATVVDSEIMDTYEGSTNRNGNISFSAGKYPELPAGETTITAGSGVSLIVYPRWWTL